MLNFHCTSKLGFCSMIAAFLFYFLIISEFSSLFPASVLSWIIFIGLELFLLFNHKFSSQPLCPNNSDKYEIWYWYSYYGIFGGFLVVCMILLMKLVRSKPGKERTLFYFTLNNVSIATIATFLAIEFDWGGICIDILG